MTTFVFDRGVLLPVRLNTPDNLSVFLYAPYNSYTRAAQGAAEWNRRHAPRYNHRSYHGQNVAFPVCLGVEAETGHELSQADIAAMGVGFSWSRAAELLEISTEEVRAACERAYHPDANAAAQQEPTEDTPDLEYVGEDEAEHPDE